MLFLYSVDSESTINLGNVELLFVNNKLMSRRVPWVDYDLRKDSFGATRMGLLTSHQAKGPLLLKTLLIFVWLFGSLFRKIENG